MVSGKFHRHPPREAILDPDFLRDRLDISQKHLAGFYQSLHRQEYPDTVSEFLDEYSTAQRTNDTIPRDSKKETTVRHIRGEDGVDENHEKGLLQTPPSIAVKPAVTAVYNSSSTPRTKPSKNKLQLPRRFLEFLESYPGKTLTSRVHSVHNSANTLTTKLVIELHDGMLVESVIMRYDKKTKIPRASLCVSSQVGCAMGCTFCATGTMGKIGNLGVAEILEQIVHANHILRKEPGSPQVRNVVFMGMGEPLDNYKNVVGACKALIDKRRWNLAHGRVTVSTVGIVSKIRQLSVDIPEVSLALSLHAPNQELRETIVPTAHRYPITDLIDALDNHMAAVDSESKPQQRKAMIEYVLLDGPTSTLKAAHELGKLCQNRMFVVNLIPYNSTDSTMKCPPFEHMRAFRTIVASYGVFCTIRRTMGADIDSACGQLVKKQQKDKASPDIEDVVPEPKRKTDKQLVSHQKRLKSLPTPDLPKEPRYDLGDYVEALAVATTLAACSFAVSLTLYLRSRR